MSQHFKRNRS